MTGPVVRLQRVHGRDTLGPGGSSRGRVHALSMDLSSGIHGILGRPSDGTSALCELVAGRARPRAGVLTVGGRQPWRSPALRRRIGASLARPSLPGVGRVRDAVAMAGRLGGVDAEGRARQLGLGELMDRRLSSLRLVEARAVDLALALAVDQPLVVVLDEPLDVTELIDRAGLMDRLRSLAAAGAAVVVTSSLPSEVEGLADHLHLLDRGRLALPDGDLGWPGAGQSELVIWLDTPEDARRLARLLSERGDLAGVAWEGRSGALGLVWVRAAELEAAAEAVAAAVANTDLEPRGLQPVTPRLQTLHDVAEGRSQTVPVAARGAIG